jgi:hypothetical protein
LGLAAAWRRRYDERRLFLLCLALPPIALFTITPLWGARGLPHWSMPGWFFAFPLMGAWLSERAISIPVLRRWAYISSGLLGAVAAVTVVQAATGWPLRSSLAGSGITDPTLEMMDWRGLRDAAKFDPAPAFVLSTRWSDAGKIALALGPNIPVFVMSADPRGWAFVKRGTTLLGRDGLLVVRRAELPAALAAAEPDFNSMGEPRFTTLARSGYPEIELALVPVKGLKREFPIPYPSDPVR